MPEILKKKTTWGVIAMAVVGILLSFGVITLEQAGVLESVIGAFTGVAARAAIEKNGPIAPE